MESTMPARKQLNGSAEEVEAAFYDALSRADLDGLMALWADDEEIVCVHPGAPRLIGHAAIRSSWEAIFERGSVHIRPMQLHAMHNLMTAVHCVIEEVAREGEAQDVHILATNVYLKTPQGWRIATHHASVAAGKAPLDLFKASILH
jgi:ketosteroid isomerase-like protein